MDANPSSPNAKKAAGQMKFYEVKMLVMSEYLEPSTVKLETEMVINYAQGRKSQVMEIEVKPTEAPEQYERVAKATRAGGGDARPSGELSDASNQSSEEGAKLCWTEKGEGDSSEGSGGSEGGATVGLA